MRVSKRFITSSVLVLIVSACGAEEVATDTSTSTSSPEPTTSTVDETVDTTSSNIESKAISALASHLQVPESDISVVRSQEKTWPDGSVGCPEPGMSYTQALVDGWQVLLQHESRVYDYHAAGDGDPFLCPSEDKDGGYDFVPPPGLDE